MAIILVRYTDIERWKKTGERVLVYGRRKTGKTFFLKNFTSYDEYFFVKRDGEILDLKSMKTISYEYLKDLLIREKKKE
jgi:SpoVK/Ycf46/Vps4 family AAA+-type ATPase